MTARSATIPQDGFEEDVFSAEFIAQRFTNVQDYPLWPQAKLHSQWPGVRNPNPPMQSIGVFSNS